MNAVTFKVKLTSERQPPKPKEKSAPRPRGSDRAARMLALAHYIDRLIDAGVLRDYADAAQVLGVTRARMTQVMDLLGLPVEVQEAEACQESGQVSPAGNLSSPLIDSIPAPPHRARQVRLAFSVRATKPRHDR